MCSMRWRAPARAVDNASALPTARAFDHMPTAFDHRVQEEHTNPLLIAAPHPDRRRSPSARRNGR
jgi:hypothetical protein